MYNYITMHGAKNIFSLIEDAPLCFSSHSKTVYYCSAGY